MFDLGFSEGIVLLIVAIVLIKPKDLPKVMRTLGHWYGQFKRMYYSVIDELQVISTLDSNETGDTKHGEKE